jgi:flagellin-like protein
MGHRRGLRKGVTPVIAIVLLLMMTVAAAGAAYTWFSQMQNRLQSEATSGLQTELSVKDIVCDASSDEIRLSLKNSGSTLVDVSDVDVFIRGSDGHLNATVQDADWTGSGPSGTGCGSATCEFADAGGFDEATIQLSNADTGSGFLVESKFYKVEADFSLSDYTLNAGGCLAD